MPASKEVVCHSCGKGFTDAEQKQFIEEFTECANCDHVRGSVAMDMWNDVPKEEWPEDMLEDED